MYCITLALSLGWFGKWKIKLAECLDGRWRGRRYGFLCIICEIVNYDEHLFFIAIENQWKKKRIFSFFLLGKSIRIVEKIWTNRFFLNRNQAWHRDKNEWMNGCMYVRMDRDGEFIITMKKWAVNKSHRFVRRNIKRLIWIIHLCRSVWKSQRIFWFWFIHELSHQCRYWVFKDPKSNRTQSTINLLIYIDVIWRMYSTSLIDHVWLSSAFVLENASASYLCPNRWFSLVWLSLSLSVSLS